MTQETARAIATASCGHGGGVTDHRVEQGCYGVVFRDFEQFMHAAAAAAAAVADREAYLRELEGVRLGRLGCLVVAY